MKKKAPKFPTYIGWVRKSGDIDCMMRLTEIKDNKAYYWRDGGLWGVQAKWVRGKLMTFGAAQSVNWLNNKELAKVTKKEWKKDNGEYV